jgi:4-amino-4-deoxy-L-arabinose transferase-like glycosyltransferase
VNWTGPGPSYQGREFQTASYIAALLYRLFGQRDWVGRAVSVAFGLLGVFALFQLARRVWDDERAVLAASVMAVLPGGFFIDRSFIPDPAMVALVTTSVWLFVAYLQTGRTGYLLLAGLIGVWGFCTKLPGLIVGLPMAYAVIAITGRERLTRAKTLAPLGLFAAMTLAPAAAYYFWARHLALAYPPHHFAGDGNWLWDDGLKSWLAQGYFLPRLGQIFKDWMWTEPVIILLALGLILVAFDRRRDRQPAHVRPGKPSGKAPWLFHYWMLAGVVFYVIGAKELVKNPWNLHIINPAAAALAGYAIVSIASVAALKKRRVAATLVTGALLLTILFYARSGLRWLYNPYAAESYHMGLALGEVSAPEDLVVTMANDFGDPVAIYYSRRRGWVFPPAEPAKAWDRLPEQDGEAIRLFEELRSRGAAWLGIVEEQRRSLLKDRPALVEHFGRACELKLNSDMFSVYRIRTPEEVALFANPPAGGD